MVRRRLLVEAQADPDRKRDQRLMAASLARRRVEAVLACIDVLLPGVEVRRQRRTAKRILTLCDGQERQRRITPAQAKDIVLRHVQCVRRDCPMLIFSEPLSRELNQFFEEEE